MNKSSIFYSIIFCLAASLTVFYSLDNTQTPEMVSATQGIKNLKQASSNDIKFTVGDTFISSNMAVYSIVEIRRSYDNKIFLVVAVKHISDYDDFISFRSAPYNNPKIIKASKFLKNKEKIDNKYISEFYNSKTTPPVIMN